MKLTATEKALIADRRAKEAEHREVIAYSRKFLKDLSDEQAVQIASQMEKEYRRVTRNPGRCTCDQQWTNPACPRVKAGWSGMACERPPQPIAHLAITLKNGSEAE